MGNASKATKKFQSKHLKHTLEHRKKLKQHNKKIQGRRGNKSEEEKQALALTKDEQKLKKASKEEVFKDMSVEKFFEGGFELPKLSGAKAGKKTQKETESSSESSSEEDLEANMGELKDKDPEFYNYLKQNDQELLEFGASNPLDAVSESDGDDSSEEDGKEEKKASKQAGGQVDVTYELVAKWKEELIANASLKLIRNLCSAFKAAVNVNQDGAADKFKYRITDAKAFQELMFLVLKDLPKALQKACPYKLSKGSRVLPSNSFVSKISPVMKGHAVSLITLLHDITNTETAVLLLHSTDALLPYFLSHRKILKELVMAITEVWATTQDAETQIAAFAFLNNSSKEFKKSMLEVVLKGIYSMFIKTCRNTNVRTMEIINLQKNSSAALFGVDPVLGYQLGFEYVRQLAIHLRNTISATSKKTQANSKDSYKIVYNWQFCHSLDFWSRVLSLQCNSEVENGTESPLRQLIYPLVQVTLGTIRLIPTAQFFPLRFYLIRSLIRLSQNTGLYIPIYPLLSEILSSTAFTKVPKKRSTLAAFNFDYNIKCNQAYLDTRVYQDGLAEQFTELVAEFYVLYAKSISFPELATPAIISLRRYMKTSKNTKFNKMLSILLDKMNQNSKLIETERSKVDFTPENTIEVKKFMQDIPWEQTPLGAYVVVQREVKEEKARILRESMQESDDPSDKDTKMDVDSDEDEDHST